MGELHPDYPDLGTPTELFEGRLRRLESLVQQFRSSAVLDRARRGSVRPPAQLQRFGVDEYIAWNLPVVGTGSDFILFQADSGVAAVAGIDSTHRWPFITIVTNPSSGIAQGYRLISREQSRSIAAQEPQFGFVVQPTGGPTVNNGVRGPSRGTQVYGLTSGSFGAGVAEPTYGAYLLIEPTTGTWKAVAKTPTGRTEVDSGLLSYEDTVGQPALAPTAIEVVFETPTKVVYSVNGQPIASIIENVPGASDVLVPTLTITEDAQAFIVGANCNWGTYFSVRYRTQGVVTT